MIVSCTHRLDAVSDARGGSLNALVLESRDGVKNAGMEVDSDGEVADDMSEEALKVCEYMRLTAEEQGRWVAVLALHW